MNDKRIAFKHIYIRFIILSVLTIFIYTFLRRYFDIKTGMVSLKEDVLDFWIPFGLSFLVLILGLRRRLRLLGNRNDGLSFQFFIAAATIAVPTIIAQNYIKVKSCSLTEVNSVYDIRKADYKDCFTIKNFDVDKDNYGLYRTSRTSGKNNQTLTFYSYFVVPIIDKNVIQNNSSTFHWLGIEFSESMSNHAGEYKKNQEWRSFYRKSMKDFHNYNFNQFQYLQGLTYSDEKDGYLKAVNNVQRHIPENKLTILTAVNEPFENRMGNKFPWILGSYFIGIIIFSIVLLFSRVDPMEYRRFKEKKPLIDDDLTDVLTYLIPRRNNFATAILIDINLIVFILMVFNGYSVVSPTPQELLELGANRRHEVLNGDAYRLFTSMFLHGGVMHLVMNVFGIGLTCALTEKILGKWQTILAYLLSGIGGSLLSIMYHENSIGVGASGAIFGMMGVMIALLLNKKAGDLSGTYILLIAIYGGISLLFGLLGGIDNAAHIGGLITGVVIGQLLVLSEKSTTINASC